MGRMLHAVILSGSGEAVKERSRELAAEALCEGPEPRPCGHCRHCRKVAREIHPDVIYIRRAPDKQGKLRREITVDQIRDLVADAAVLPNEAVRKVYIFPEAETMNTAAQNAFLKLLEEPPEWVVFLLCTRNAESLLATVRSRCGEEHLAPEDRERAEDRVSELAAGYLTACHDRAELLRCCIAMEKLDTQTLLSVVRAIRERAPERGLPPAELLELEAFLARGEQYLLANLGVKQVTGYLSTYYPTNGK